jgi:hypothetical protein
MAIAKQWLSKHISMVTNKHETVEGSWKLGFLCGVCQGCIMRTSWWLVVGRSVSQFASSRLLVSNCT